MPKARPTVGQGQPQAEQPLLNGIIGTPEQNEIWKVGTDPQGPHIIVKSVAGSGKTFTGVELCKRLPVNLKVAFVAFNKHIQLELQQKLAEYRHVQAMTYHGLGLRALRSHFGQVEIDEHKVDTILDQMKNFYKGWTDSKVRYVQARTRRLVGLAKQYGAWDRAELEKLVDHHDLALDGIEDEVYELTPLVMRKCLDVKKGQKVRVDFDDMVWMPKQVQAKMPRFDVMLIDEAQDTNLSQQWLALNGAGRLVVIGDPCQAIYGFRGSDTESMNRLRDELAKTERKVVELGLSQTRRCPKSHVKLAQKIVPQIKPLDEAPDGQIRVESTSVALGQMRPGDLVICRVNAPLLETAYALLKMGVRAVVRGRDIGEGIRKLIEQAQKRVEPGLTNNVGEVLAAADTITMELVQKLSKKANTEARIGTAHDRMACLTALAEEAQTVTELLNTLRKLFDDFDDDGQPQAAVVLGTVHRTKGLEGFRVYILEPGKIPHSMAKKPWERNQEMNLAYVAVTRAKYGEVRDQKIEFNQGQKTMVGELIFVGQECPLWPEPEFPKRDQTAKQPDSQTVKAPLLEGMLEGEDYGSEYIGIRRREKGLSSKAIEDMFDSQEQEGGYGREEAG